jgi:hypothetical protein
MNFRGFPWRLYDRNAEVVNPGRNVTRAGDPLHVGLGRKSREERSPDGRHFSAAMDGDPAEKRAGMGHARKRGPDEIGWPAHRGWQVPKNFLLEPRHSRQAGGRLGRGSRGEFREIESCCPRLEQGCRRRARKPGKFFNAVEVAEAGGEGSCDSGFESVWIDRLKETAGQTGSEPLHR